MYMEIFPLSWAWKSAETYCIRTVLLRERVVHAIKVTSVESFNSQYNMSIRQISFQEMAMMLFPHFCPCWEIRILLTNKGHS